MSKRWRKEYNLDLTATQPATIGQVDQLLNQVLTERESPTESQSPQSPGLLAAMGRGQIDGSLTGGDVLVCVGIMGTFVVGGSLVAAVAALTGTGIDSAAYILRDFTRAGVYLALARLAVDAFNLVWLLAEMWSSLLSTLLQRWDESPQINDEMDRGMVVRPIFVAGLAGGKELTAASLEATQAGKSSQSESGNFLVSLPRGRPVEYELLADVLRTASTRGGTAWSKEHWCNQPDADVPGNARLRPSTWYGIKAFCDRAGVWRTEDVGLIEELLANILTATGA